MGIAGDVIVHIATKEPVLHPVLRWNNLADNGLWMFAQFQASFPYLDQSILIVAEGIFIAPKAEFKPCQSKAQSAHGVQFFENKEI